MLKRTEPSLRFTQIRNGITWESSRLFGVTDMSEILRDLHLFADDTEIGQGCRMRVTLREEFSLMPQLFHLEIENLSESSAELLSNCKEMAVRSNGSVLAAGDSIFCCPRWIDGRKILAVSFSYGFRLWKASVSLSLAAGMKISDTIREVLKASGTGIQLAGYTARDFALTPAGGQRGRTGRADAGGGMRDRDGRADADGGDAGGRAAFGADISEGSGDIEDGDCRVAAGDLCAVQMEWR